MEEALIDGRQQQNSPLEELQTKLDIRQRLKQWESENASSIVLPRETLEKMEPESIYNTLTQALDGKFELDTTMDSKGDDDLGIPGFGQDDLQDVGTRRNFLRPGDLVELR